MARDPPIFVFLESRISGKVYNSTKNCPINYAKAYLMVLKILQQKYFGLTDFWFGYDRENDDKNLKQGISTNLQPF